VADFFHPGWAIFIAVVTVLSLVACIALLLVAARRRKMADDNTTGHVWDEDLRELNNPLWPTTTPLAMSGTRTCAN